jgi:hypothetical protein
MPLHTLSFKKVYAKILFFVISTTLNPEKPLTNVKPDFIVLRNNKKTLMYVPIPNVAGMMKFLLS